MVACLIAEVFERLDVAAHDKIAEIGDELSIQFLAPTAKGYGFSRVATRAAHPTESQASSDAFQQFVETHRLRQDGIEAVRRNIAMPCGRGTCRQGDHR